MTRLALALAAALLLSCRTASPSASAPATPPDAYAAGIAACMAEKASARAVLATQACEQDWDCVPYQQVWLGCDGWRDARAPDPALARTLESACVGVPSRALECSGKVGACVQGRCAARPAPPVDCAGAMTALSARAAAAPTACAADAGCQTWEVGDARWPVAAGFEHSAAPELHRVRGACGEESPWGRALPNEKPRLGRAPGRCVEARCVDDVHHDRVPPRFRDGGCVVQVTERWIWGVKPTGKVLMKFLVASDGRRGAFMFLGAPESLQRPLAEAVLACPMEPGTEDGRPTAMWVIMPLRFVDG